MVKIIPFEDAHLEQINIQSTQKYVLSLPDRKEHAKLIKWSQCAYSALDGGICYAIAGIVELEPWRAAAWSLLSADMKKYIVPIVRAIRRVLDVQTYDRVELVCHADFEPSIRWSKLLGFTEEGVLRNYYPGGRDGIMFARIK